MTVISKSSAYPKTVQPGIPKLGKLPDGWMRGPLAEHLFEERRPISMDDNVEYDLVTVKRARGGVVRREHLKGKQISVKSQFKVCAGDFLISKRQIVHGACGLVPKELDGSIVSNEYAVLRSAPTLNLNFLNYLAHSQYFQQTCFHSSIGVHVEKMIFKLEKWLNWNFDIPPLEEQKKIADILSTWDRAIETVEKLIANSQAQKKALMQQLLTGKNRLPGFQDNWSEFVLGSIGDTYSGLSGKSKKDFGSGQIYVPYKNVFENSEVDFSSIDYVQIADGENQNDVRHGDIIFTTSSETPEEVGMSSVVISPPARTYLNSFCFGFRPKNLEQLNPIFSKHFFRGPDIRRKISSLAQGSTRHNLSKREMLKLRISLPPFKEQNEIAFLLDSADRTETKFRNIYKCLKKEKSALMQQLLTGKRRVKIKESNE